MKSLFFQDFGLEAPSEVVKPVLGASKPVSRDGITSSLSKAFSVDQASVPVTSPQRDYLSNRFTWQNRFKNAKRLKRQITSRLSRAFDNPNAENTVVVQTYRDYVTQRSNADATPAPF